MAGQPRVWAGVGSANVRSNHARVSGEKTESASTESDYRPVGRRTSVRFLAPADADNRHRLGDAPELDLAFLVPPGAGCLGRRPARKNHPRTGERRNPRRLVHALAGVTRPGPHRLAGVDADSHRRREAMLPPMLRQPALD